MQKLSPFLCWIIHYIFHIHTLLFGLYYSSFRYVLLNSVLFVSEVINESSRVESCSALLKLSLKIYRVLKLNMFSFSLSFSQVTFKRILIELIVSRTRIACLWTYWIEQWLAQNWFQNLASFKISLTSLWVMLYMLKKTKFELIWVSFGYRNSWIICEIGSPLRLDNRCVFNCSKRIKGEWEIIHPNFTIDMKKYG